MLKNTHLFRSALPWMVVISSAGCGLDLSNDAGVPYVASDAPCASCSENADNSVLQWVPVEEKEPSETSNIVFRMCGTDLTEAVKDQAVSELEERGIYSPVYATTPLGVVRCTEDSSKVCVQYALTVQPVDVVSALVGNVLDEEFTVSTPGNCSSFDACTGEPQDCVEDDSNSATTHIYRVGSVGRIVQSAHEDHDEVLEMHLLFESKYGADIEESTEETRTALIKECASTGDLSDISWNDSEFSTVPTEEEPEVFGFYDSSDGDGCYYADLSGTYDENSHFVFSMVAISDVESLTTSDETWVSACDGQVEFSYQHDVPTFSMKYLDQQWGTEEGLDAYECPSERMNPEYRDFSCGFSDSMYGTLEHEDRLTTFCEDLSTSTWATLGQAVSERVDSSILSQMTEELQSALPWMLAASGLVQAKLQCSDGTIHCSSDDLQVATSQVWWLDVESSSSGITFTVESTVER